MQNVYAINFVMKALVQQLKNSKTLLASRNIPLAMLPYQLLRFTHIITLYRIEALSLALIRKSTENEKTPPGSPHKVTTMFAQMRGHLYIFYNCQSQALKCC